MKNKTYAREGLLVLTALIWGAAFVAQTTGGSAIGPLTFACLRYFIAAVVLLPFLPAAAHRAGHPADLSPARLTSDAGSAQTNSRRLPAWVSGGMICGFFLALCSIFQQLGLNGGTPVGRAGFLTACYVVMVPLLGLLFGRRCGLPAAAAAVLTLLGLWLLSGSGDGFVLRPSDGLILLCALSISFQIICIDRYAPRLTDAEAMKLTWVQFFTAGTVGLVPMLIFEVFGGDGAAAWLSRFGRLDAWIPLLYAGVLSSAVGYTLQTVGQRGVHPTVASLLMSLESVFAALFGWLLLNERLSARELIGCGTVFAAVVLAQLPADILRRRRPPGSSPR